MVLSCLLMFYINNDLRFEALEAMLELRSVSQVAFDSDDDGKLIGQDPAVPLNPNGFILNGSMDWFKGKS